MSNLMEPGDIYSMDIIPPDDILEFYANANVHRKAVVSAVLTGESKFLFSFLREGVDPSHPTKHAGNTVYLSDTDALPTLVFMLLSLFTMSAEEPEFRLGALRGVVMFIYSLPQHVKVEFQELLRQYGEKGSGE